MNNSVVISASNIVKEYGDGKRCIRVLNGVSLEIVHGEMVGIVGQSGCGKSTLMHVLGGLDTATSGEVFIAGHSMLDQSERRQASLRNAHLGFVYQFHHLLAEFSAIENVAMPCLLAGWSTGKARERALELIDAVGLANRASHKPGELSGGEKQRMAFARALATQPDCVLADEPTGNLDQTTAAEVFEWMLTLNQRFNTSFLVVTHAPEIAARLNRTLILSEGILRPAGDPEPVI